MSLPIFIDPSANRTLNIPIWKKILKTNFTKVNEFVHFLELDDEQKKLIEYKPRFCLNVPLRFALKMKKGSLEDPLVKQFLPLQNENSIDADFKQDPVGDSCSKISSKLLQKYEGRVLLLATSACAVHCRYCFRQNFDYETQNKTFEKELNIIENDQSVHEVILSGGDPLSLSDDQLEPLLFRLNSISHVKRIRFHTRMPIGIPERIDESFLSLIRKLEKQIWFIVHINHPSELDRDVLDSLKALRKIGCSVLNQAVLLKGVNDDFSTLKQLCELLVDNGILPYYLHQLDRVSGSAHFETEIRKGKQLIKALAHSLPGYAVPKYVKEIAGQKSKTAIF